MTRPTGLRVLIVEDDLILALNAEMILDDAGHTVLGTATTEDQAIKMALDLRPDVMLVDLRLARGGCGRRVAERVLAEIDTHVIFVSGNLTEDVQQRLSALSPLAMISKPYMDSQILGALNSLQ